MTNKPIPRGKGQTMIYKTLHGNLKIKTTRTSQKIGDQLGWSGSVGTSCFTSGTYHVTIVKSMVISSDWRTCYMYIL